MSPCPGYSILRPLSPLLETSLPSSSHDTDNLDPKTFLTPLHSTGHGAAEARAPVFTITPLVSLDTETEVQEADSTTFPDTCLGMGYCLTHLV